MVYCDPPYNISLDYDKGLGTKGKYGGKQPPDRLRERIKTYMDPLPFYYEPLESQMTDTTKYPLNALTQRPMAMYHSWDSQNAWLRQIHGYNTLFVHPSVGAALSANRWPSAALA